MDANQFDELVLMTQQEFSRRNSKRLASVLDLVKGHQDLLSKLTGILEMDNKEKKEEAFDAFCMAVSEIF